MTPAAGYAYPPRVDQVARAGLAEARAGRRTTVVDRLYAYEIQDAARQLAFAEDGERSIAITAYGERVTFALVDPR